MRWTLLRLSACAMVALVVSATAPAARAARSSVAAATYLGGTGTDSAQGVAVDARGDVYVVGTTSSANFPVKDAMQAIYGGAGANDNGDVFVAKLTDGGTRLVYA